MEAGATSHGFTDGNVNPLSESEGLDVPHQAYPVKNCGRKKRKRNNDNGEGDDGKPKEVVHVRAKRGQATDSHSLAERGANLYEAQGMGKAMVEGPTIQKGENIWANKTHLYSVRPKFVALYRALAH
nr:transcription factor BEE 1-like [Ipomoea batatas]